MSNDLAFLPPPAAVDAADDKLASFMSDLDLFKSAAAAFAGDDVSLDDAAFVNRSGIALENAPRHVDPAVIARLLVFANEVLDDLATMREGAEALRRDLLRAYRNEVLESRASGVSA